MTIPPLEQLAWLSNQPGGTVVLSTRLRLARNLEGHPFPARAQPSWLEAVLACVGTALKAEAPGLGLSLVRLDRLSRLNQELLVERHLVSPALLTHPHARAVALRDDGTLSVMVNEEDHLRLQALLPGGDYEAAWRLVDEVDDRLEQHLDYAFDDRLGYLTACPTNVGTGMRASAMLHLPALNWDVWKTRAMEQIVAQIAHMGLTVRGLYGEGSQVSGNLFQVSNQVTLGNTEQEILSRVTLITDQLVSYELGAREELRRRLGGLLEDRVWRSWGLLRHARMMTTAEALEHLSMLRLGTDLGILPSLPPGSLNRLQVAIRPANLQAVVGRDLEPAERDFARATVVREALA
ncbi:MAG: protein arginine kinase [Candidatus Eremiobacterota bacterium]